MTCILVLFVCLTALGFVGYSLVPTLYYLFFKKAPFPPDPNGKRIFLTFDDGPDPRYTPTLLGILRENNVHAIFFVVAEKAARHPELIQEISRAGHLIGLHGLNHRDAWLTTPAGQKRDFEQGLAILETLGCDVTYYRAPWGHLNLTSLFLAKQHQLNVMLWTVMAEDWEAESISGRILKRLFKRVRNGSVICLHDSGCGKGAAPGAPEHTVKAVAEFVPRMLGRGFQFVLPADCGKHAKGDWAR